jgi:hypothetical protein
MANWRYDKVNLLLLFPAPFNKKGGISPDNPLPDMSSIPLEKNVPQIL